MKQGAKRAAILAAVGALLDVLLPETSESSTTPDDRLYTSAANPFRSAKEFRRLARAKAFPTFTTTGRLIRAKATDVDAYIESRKAASPERDPKVANIDEYLERIGARRGGR